MVVQAAWPGATLDDTLQQVTERLERTAAGGARTSTRCAATRGPGVTTIFVDLLGSVTGSRGAGRSGSGCATTSTTSATPCRAGVVGPGFNDDFGDTFGIIYGFTADGFTHRELRDQVEDVRSRAAARARRLEDRDPRRAGRARSSSSSRCEQLAEPRASTARRCSPRCRRRTWSARPASSQTGDERISLRVSGAFESEQDILDINFVAGGRMLRLQRHRRGAPRLRRPAAADVPRRTASRRSGSASPCATAATSWRWATISSRRWRDITADLPVGIEPHPGGRPAGHGRRRHRRVHDLAVAGDRHHPGVSFISLGVRAGLGRGARDPADAGHRVPAHAVCSASTCSAISLGALIIALALLVDDAMTTTDAMTDPARRRRRQAEGRDVRLHDLRLRHADRHAGHDRGLRADRLRRRAPPASTPSRIFAVVTIALIVSWLVAVIFAPLLGVVHPRRPRRQPVRRAAAGGPAVPQLPDPAPCGRAG